MYTYQQRLVRIFEWRAGNNAHHFRTWHSPQCLLFHTQIFIFFNFSPRNFFFQIIIIIFFSQFLPLKWADLCIYKNKYEFLAIFLHLKLQINFFLQILYRLYYFKYDTLSTRFENRAQLKRDYRENFQDVYNFKNGRLISTEWIV